jgi:hypothetical protein
MTVVNLVPGLLVDGLNQDLGAYAPGTYNLTVEAMISWTGSGEIGAQVGVDAVAAFLPDPATDFDQDFADGSVYLTFSGAVQGSGHHTMALQDTKPVTIQEGFPILMLSAGGGPIQPGGPGVSLESGQVTMTLRT